MAWDFFNRRNDQSEVGLLRDINRKLDTLIEIEKAHASRLSPHDQAALNSIFDKVTAGAGKIDKTLG